MTKKGFAELCKRKKKTELLKNGFCVWDDEKPTLMLIPSNLYNSIPNGYTVYSLGRKKEKFKSGVSDNDSRFGCLPYGVLI